MGGGPNVLNVGRNKATIYEADPAATIRRFYYAISGDAPDVITSYSIHYTKLYDTNVVLERRVAIKVLHSALGHNEVAGARLLREAWRHFADARVPASRLVTNTDHENAIRTEAVITSYSIHYTKLYDTNVCHG